MVLLLPSLDDWVDPEFASGPSRQESMPEESSTSEAADPTTQSSKPSPGTGGTHHFEELQSELRILKDQIVVALSKVKRAAKREDYLLDLIFRASDDLLCKFHKAPKSLSWSRILSSFPLLQVFS
jgi:hypothetical protein